MTRQNAPKESLTAGDYLFSKTQYKFRFFLLHIFASWKILEKKIFRKNFFFAYQYQSETQNYI